VFRKLFQGRPSGREGETDGQGASWRQVLQGQELVGGGKQRGVFAAVNQLHRAGRCASLSRTRVIYCWSLRLLFLIKRFL
jgi:hypothetical protein